MVASVASLANTPLHGASDLPSSMNMGRRRRTVMLAAVGLAIFCASIAHNLPNRPSFKAPFRLLADEAHQALPIAAACATPALLSYRNEADFWRITVDASHNLVIQPANSSAYFNCPELALATFALRLHYSNETHLVRSPPRQGPMGRYLFSELPAPILSTEVSGEAEVEARLEFGHFSGVAAAQPCNAAKCAVDVLPTLNSGLWSGNEILGEDGRRAKVQIRPRRIARPDAVTQSCETVNDLPAVAVGQAGQVLFTTPQGAPCVLPTLPPGAPVPPQPRWIHLAGDSNFRPLVLSLTSLLGSGACTWATLKAETYPTHAVCEDAGSGFIVTFSFVWFKGPTYGGPRDYEGVDLSSLKNFVTSMPFEAGATRPSAVMLDIPLTHLFISTGSHAPQLSAVGMQQALDDYRAAFDVKISQAAATSFVSVTSVDPALIPSKFGNQAALRNNIVINKLNRLQRDWVSRTYPAASVDYLDIFSMTSVLPAKSRRDAVHFQQDIYDEWAKIFVAAVELARRLQEKRL